MGFLSSLFKKKEVADQRFQNVTEKVSLKDEKTRDVMYPSNSGLYPQEIMMLFYAPKYRTDETNFPDFFRQSYHIGFPNEVLTKLSSENYIRESKPSESMDKLKMPELKKIASNYGLRVSGRKSELINRIIENLTEKDLAEYVSERYWVLTEKGTREAEENEYLKFLVENHPYSQVLDECGITLAGLNRMHHTQPNGNIRDLVWGEFNNVSIKTFQNSIKDGNFQKYCTILHAMAQFLEEDERFNDALNMYARYLFYNINFNAGMQCIKYLRFVDDLAQAADTFYYSADIAPYDASAIVRVSTECNMSSTDLKRFLSDFFEKQDDKGIFSIKDLTDFVMAGLSGDQELVKVLSRKAAKIARNKIRKI